MTCHSQIWSDSPVLEPVRASFRNDTPLKWTRVHDLPDFVYFDHSIHIHKGIRLRHVSRECGTDAPDVERGDPQHGVVSGLPPAPGAFRQAKGPGFNPDWEHPPTRSPRGAGSFWNMRFNPLRLRHMPQMTRSAHKHGLDLTAIVPGWPALTERLLEEPRAARGHPGISRLSPKESEGASEWSSPLGRRKFFKADGSLPGLWRVGRLHPPAC